MKTRIILVLFAAILSMLSVSVGQTSDQTISGDKVEVYYFHNERRCATCQAVEDESVKALNELYPEKMKSGEITFLSVNLEDDANKALADKYKVSGQSLLVTKGSSREDLTNTAFMHAKSNPDKLKKAIREAVEKF